MKYYAVFIGGCKDGERRVMPSLPPTITIPKLRQCIDVSTPPSDPAGPTPVEYEVYHRALFSSAQYAIYAPSGMHPDQLLEKIIEGYKRG